MFAWVGANIPVISSVTNAAVVGIVNEGMSDSESVEPCEIPMAAEMRDILCFMHNEIESVAVTN